MDRVDSVRFKGISHTNTVERGTGLIVIRGGKNKDYIQSKSTVMICLPFCSFIELSKFMTQEKSNPSYPTLALMQLRVAGKKIQPHWKKEWLEKNTILTSSS